MDDASCATCGTTEGLHRWVRISAEGWTCIPCVRASQAAVTEAPSEVERCQDCGRPVPVRWWAATELFDAVTEHGPSILCVECFDRRARAKGQRLTWVPLAEPAASEFVEADTTAAFAAWQALPQAVRDAREASHASALDTLVPKVAAELVAMTRRSRQGQTW